MVLKDIAMFHDRHRRQPVFKCCNDLNRMKSHIHPLIPEMKEKHSATVCDPIIENSFDKSVLILLLFFNINSVFFSLEFLNHDIIVINHFHVHQS